jgi:phosphoribosyl-ATP pyrophosphohydrolase/phosphoribosyl-AMP cyclohydrolase
LSIDLSKLNFDSNGLIPAIVQDVQSGDVLMLAYMNDEAVSRTVETGLTHFYSRSRRKLWQKGETSGHVQRVKEVLYDCDADCILIRAEQVVAACHTGHRSCFHNTLDGDVKGEPVFDAEKVYSGAENREIINRLYKVILDRKSNPDRDSYTSMLLSGGADMISGKITEEARELAQAAAGKDQRGTICEAADLVYHTLVLLAHAGVPIEQVKEELAKRFGTGGLEEKASRKT